MILVLALAVAPEWVRTEGEDIPEPKGPPKQQLSEADLPPYPEKAPARPSGDAYAHQDYFWFNDNDGKQQWEDPALVLTDEEGRESYIDPATGKITDVRPAEAAWLSLWSETHEQEYFYNEISKETTWDVPNLFAWHKVYVDENGTVVAPPPEEEEGEEFDGEGGGWSEEELQAMDAGGADGGWAPAEYAYDDMHEGHGHEGHVHEGEQQEPLEEDLAEEEVLRQEAAAGGETSTGEL